MFESVFGADALCRTRARHRREAAGLEGPAHEADDILRIATYFQNLFERDAIGPGSPDAQSRTDGRYGFYGLRGGPCVGFGHHVLLKNV